MFSHKRRAEVCYAEFFVLGEVFKEKLIFILCWCDICSVLLTVIYAKMA